MSGCYGSPRYLGSASLLWCMARTPFASCNSAWRRSITLIYLGESRDGCCRVPDVGANCQGSVGASNIVQLV
jgi:hypothetical protein